jgi:hypothetical protein
MDGAITRSRGKPLNREKIGHEVLLAYDESKKLLAVVSSSKVMSYVFTYVTEVVLLMSLTCKLQLQLHVFVFDDVRGFQALGSAINLHPWYNDASSIRLACFVSGSEELLLVDSQAQARVFSLVTLQFRCV